MKKITTGEDKEYKIPLFDGANYDNWKFSTQTLLDEMSLLDLNKTDYRKCVQIEAGDSDAKKGKDTITTKKKQKIQISNYLTNVRQ